MKEAMPVRKGKEESFADFITKNMEHFNKKLA
jgi:hypothetical protein